MAKARIVSRISITGVFNDSFSLSTNIPLKSVTNSFVTEPIINTVSGVTGFLVPLLLSPNPFQEDISVFISNGNYDNGNR